MDLAGAMKAAGLSNETLAKKVGMPSSRIAAYKSGGRGLGQESAGRLAEVLEESPESLLVGNRAAVLERAVKRRDRHGVLDASKGLLEAAEQAGADAQTLDQIVEIGTRFASATKTAAPGFYDDEDHLDEDGRDSLGRKVTKSRRTATPEESRAESEDVDDEGRDSRGIRVRPMEGV